MASSPPDYLLHLAKDRKLGKYLKTHEPFPLKRHRNICLRLCASIMSQQLSTKVARVIYTRFLELFGGAEPTPEQILEQSPETLRSIGLSNAKVSYVRNVAAYALEHGMDDKKLLRMSDDDIRAFLLPIKGVGHWTVEMLLMFTLGREDIFAVDDLGIQQAMIKVYGFDPSDKKLLKEQMLKQSLKWKPYRTYACMHLWHLKDNAPSQ